MEEGAHPDPFRTRQLSPPSPRVLQRKAAGGKDAAAPTGGSRAFGRDLARMAHCYSKGGSAGAGAPGSMPPTYPLRDGPMANAKLQ